MHGEHVLWRDSASSDANQEASSGAFRALPFMTASKLRTNSTSSCLRPCQLSWEPVEICGDDLLTATCITCDAGSCPNHCGKVNAGPGRCSPCHGGITAGSSPHFPSPRRISPTAIAGGWNLQAGQPHHYMLRRRNGAAGLQVSYVLLQLAPKCQAVGCPERIFVNRIRKPAKGKGKGKGKQAKGKGKGRGKQDQPAAPHNGAPPPAQPPRSPSPGRTSGPSLSSPGQLS